MNKKGLFAGLFIIIVLVIAVIVGIVYFTGSFGFRTGKVSVDIDYDNSANFEEPSITEIDEQDLDDFLNGSIGGNLSDVDIGENKSLNYTNISE